MKDGLPEMEITNAVGTAGWRLFTCEEADSTNDLARSLPPWSAVRAKSQRTGRGRFGRAFVSDPGGLWISAVLPSEGGALKWAGFSLMVGAYLIRMLEEIHVPGARLRWPNDLMAGRKKLGGLLIEQAGPGAFIVGFGLNVRNEPWKSAPELESIATSLQAELTDPPGVSEMAIRTLNALAEAHQAMEDGGMTLAINELNARWTDPVPVRVFLSSGSTLEGLFLGLDPAGHLRVTNADNSQMLVEHQSVERLVELI